MYGQKTRDRAQIQPNVGLVQVVLWIAWAMSTPISVYKVRAIYSPRLNAFNLKANMHEHPVLAAQIPVHNSQSTWVESLGSRMISRADKPLKEKM